MLISRSNTRGIALISVMTFLLILTLLILSAFDTSLLATKESQQQWELWQTQQQAISVNRQHLQAIEKGQQPSCVIPFNIDDIYWQSKFTFWSTQPACVIHNNVSTSYSIMEKLPTNTCTKLKKNISTEVFLYRITTFVKSTHAAQCLVQSIVLHTTPTQKTCHNPEPQVSLGLQTWRME